MHSVLTPQWSNTEVLLPTLLSQHMFVVNYGSLMTLYALWILPQEVINFL